MTDDVIHGVFQAGNKLKNFIDEDDDISPIQSDMKWPLVVLAFDEAHNLTEVPDNRGWSMYSELRRCLQQLLDFPIFTLFLSTAGKFHLFSPQRPKDPSSRVVLGHKRVLPPITETGFDQLALRAIENQTTLDQVVGHEWICRLGRPLYVFMAFALCQRPHILLRVGFPPVMSSLGQVIGLALRPCNLLLRSYWVVTKTSMGMLMTHGQHPLTGPLPVYLCAFLWNSTSRTQIRNPWCASRSNIICDSAP